MRPLWHDVMTHRLVAGTFLLVWAALLVAVWLIGDELFLLQLPLIAVASGVVVWWRVAATGSTSTVNTVIGAGVLAALLLGVVDALVGSAAFVATFMAWGYAPGLGWDRLFRDVVLALVMMLGATLVVGIVGSFLGLAIVDLVRHLHGSKDPSRPQDTP